MHNIGNWTSLTRYMICAIVIFSCESGFSQEWKKHLPIAGDQSINSLLEDYDSGILLPLAEFKVGFDIVKLKTNSDVLWKRSYSVGDGVFIISGLQIVSDGYLLWGGTDLLDENLDPYLLKLNWCMEPVWSKVFRVPDVNYIDEVLVLTDSTVLLQCYGLQQDYTTFLLYNSISDSIYYHYTLDFYVGNFTQIKNELYICGYAYVKDVNDTLLEWSKAAFYKSSLDGSLFWAKYYYPDDTVHHTLSADIVGIGDHSLLALIREGRPNHSDPTIVNGVRIFLLDTSGQIRKNCILSDTLKQDLPEQIIKLSDNRYAILSNYGPTDGSYSFLKLYLIDSSVNLIKTLVLDITSFGYDTGAGALNFPRILYKLEDSSILIGGNFLSQITNYDIYLIKVDADLNVVSKTVDNNSYNYLCAKSISDSTVQLPFPDTVYLDPADFGLTAVPTYPMKEIVSVEPLKNMIDGCKVYPNPVKDFLTLVASPEENYRVEIIDALGLIHKVFSPVWNNGETQIPFSGFHYGTWFLRITSLETGKTAVFKVIKY